MNTRFLRGGFDLLSDTAGLAEWFANEDLVSPTVRATQAELARAIELREALRAVLAAHGARESVPAHASRTLDAAARRARLRLHFDDEGGASLVSEAATVDGALGRLLAIVHDAIAHGTWTRLKACREHDCGWAFYDHTKNRSGASGGRVERPGCVRGHTRAGAVSREHRAQRLSQLDRAPQLGARHANRRWGQVLVCEPFGQPRRIAQKIDAAANLAGVDEPSDPLEFSRGAASLTHNHQFYFDGYEPAILL